jgi:integrase
MLVLPATVVVSCGLVVSIQAAPHWRTSTIACSASCAPTVSCARISSRGGWAQSNPVAYVDRPRKNRSRHQRVRFLQPAELDKLIDAVPEDTLGRVERPLYLAAALTGLRQGELLALKWLDIDW